MAIAEKLSKIWVSPATLSNSVANDTTGRGVNNVANDTIEINKQAIRQILARTSTVTRISEIRTIAERSYAVIPRDLWQRRSPGLESMCSDHYRRNCG
jgi:hypothetical protein